MASKSIGREDDVGEQKALASVDDSTLGVLQIIAHFRAKLYVALIVTPIGKVFTVRLFFTPSEFFQKENEVKRVFL